MRWRKTGASQHWGESLPGWARAVSISAGARRARRGTGAPGTHDPEAERLAARRARLALHYTRVADDCPVDVARAQG